VHNSCISRGTGFQPVRHATEVTAPNHARFFSFFQRDFEDFLFSLLTRDGRHAIYYTTSMSCFVFHSLVIV
jgi:hypothetical protein